MSKWLRPAASVLLLSWVAWRTDWAQVASAFANLRAGWWLAAVALYAVTQVVSSGRWALLARPLGFRLPTSRFVHFYFVGMFFNLVLPTSVGGDVVRAWSLDGRTGRRLTALVSVLADRGSGLAVLIGLACAASLVTPVPLPGWVTAAVWSAAGLAVVGGATAVGLAHLRPVGRLGRLRDELRLAWSAYAPRPGLVLVAVLLSVAVQAANVVLVALIGRAMGLDVPWTYYGVFVPLVTLLTMLPVSLNGMGVREGGAVLLLAPLGVPDGAAVSLALLWFAAFTVVSLFGLGFYLFGRSPRFEVRRDDEPVGGDPTQGREGQRVAAA